MGIIEQVKQIKLEEAHKEERKKATRLFVENLLSGTDLSINKIASLANVSVQFVNRVKTSLKVK